MRFTLPVAAVVLASVLPAQTTLKAIRTVVSDSEDGPAVTAEGFRSGEQVFFSFQVENYKTGPTGKVQLTGHIQAFDPKGIPVSPPDEVVIGTTMSEEDKAWKPKLRAQIQLPSIAPAGTYAIKYDVTDLQTKQTASGEVTFRLSGRTVASADVLTIRGLGLYRTQDEETPLRVAAYRPGDILWVRFDVVGFRHGEQNSIDVAYDVAVVTGDGKPLFAQELAAVEKSQAFYPQPWVPGEFNLTLQSNMSTGPYTLIITAHDGIDSDKTVVAKAQFKVE